MHLIYHLGEHTGQFLDRGLFHLVHLLEQDIAFPGKLAAEYSEIVAYECSNPCPQRPTGDGPSQAAEDIAEPAPNCGAYNHVDHFCADPDRRRGESEDLVLRIRIREWRGHVDGPVPSQR